MTLGAIGLQGDRLASSPDAFLEQLPALAFRRVAAEPVVGARELPRSLERAGAARGQVRLPDVGRLPRAREVRTFGV